MSHFFKIWYSIFTNKNNWRPDYYKKKSRKTLDWTNIISKFHFIYNTMGAIIRNFLLACLISTFAFFGILGASNAHKKSDAKLPLKEQIIRKAEVRKQTFTLFGVIGITWVLCFWRCGVINRRLSAERLNQQRFNEYMRSTAYQRQYR